MARCANGSCRRKALDNRIFCQDCTWKRKRDIDGGRNPPPVAFVPKTLGVLSPTQLKRDDDRHHAASIAGDLHPIDIPSGVSYLYYSVVNPPSSLLCVEPPEQSGWTPLLIFYRYGGHPFEFQAVRHPQTLPMLNDLARYLVNALVGDWQVKLIRELAQTDT